MNNEDGLALAPGTRDLVTCGRAHDAATPYDIEHVVLGKAVVVARLGSQPRYSEQVLWQLSEASPAHVRRLDVTARLHMPKR